MSLLIESDYAQRNVGCIAANEVSEYMELVSPDLLETFRTFDSILDGKDYMRPSVRGNRYELSLEMNGDDVVRSLIIPVRTKRGRTDFSAGHDISYVATPEGLVVGHKQVFEQRIGRVAMVELPTEPLSQIDRKHFSLVASLVANA